MYGATVVNNQYYGHIFFSMLCKGKTTRLFTSSHPLRTVGALFRQCPAGRRGEIGLKTGVMNESQRLGYSRQNKL